MKPFANKEYFQPKGLDKLFKKIPQKNFLIDLNNLLVKEKLENTTKEQIKELEEKYKIKNSGKKFKPELISIFREFLSENLGNPKSDVNSYQSARRFQELLGVSEKDFDIHYESIADEKFKNKLDEVVHRKMKIGDEEDKELDRYQKLLAITQEKADQFSEEIRNDIVQKFVNAVIADKRITPEEDAGLEKLCKDLKIHLSFEDKDKNIFDKFRSLWKIENEELPNIETDIMLPKTERCYLQCTARLYETRKVTKSVSYGDPTLRLKIMKGVYYRVGNIGIQRHSEDVLTLIDDGRLFITNKRILFAGGKQNRTIKYNQIIDITPYSDGVEISKDAGRSPTFAPVGVDIEILVAILARAIKDSE
jgi:hypothetical protein